MPNLKESHTSNEEGARVYKNPILHYLSQTHIAVPLVIFYGVGISLCIYSYTKFDLSIILILGLFVLGMLTFSLVEYLMHRFIYHLPSVYQEGGIAFALHGIHHKFPRDKKRLVMPPILSVVLASIILSLNFFLMGNNGFPFTAGFLFGYAAYLSVHYIVHRYKPPNNVFRVLWIHHSIHHYQDDEVAFGVSSPLWDYVFGTMPKSKK
tara:strand:+ start:2396 stop:3019 length:624 start_codon:yes stop_codon:yes gene_type:complete